MIIDAHTHIHNEQILKDYSTKGGRRISRSVVMAWYKDSLEELLKFVDKHKNLVVVGTIDVFGDLGGQLKNIEELFKRKRAVGLKLYPGYQHFYPSDKEIWPIAELCQEYERPLIFHSGDVYDPEGSALLKYTEPIYIDELAVKFPQCKIIVSHFGFPYFLETAMIMSRNANVYTELSGVIDSSETLREKKRKLIEYVQDLERVFAYYPNLKSKVMFGTDYGGEDTPLNLVQPYIDLVQRVFIGKERKNVFYRLAEKLFFEK